MNIVILGLSITSAWGNGHATTYRSLAKAMVAEGHRVTFLERDVPWYREHRDWRSTSGVTVILYPDLATLFREHVETVQSADALMVGSYVPEGRAVIAWALKHARGVSMFYDIDTPITLAGLAQGGTEYLGPADVPRFDLYLSFTGGPTLERLERSFGARRARALYCSVDPDEHYPVASPERWTLGYLGTYSSDRQAALEELLCAPARTLDQESFVVAGAQYPSEIAWPANVERREHVAPKEHGAFYSSLRFTLNLTRAEMIRAGYSPSVRLFEAAACGVPIISDSWPGLPEFFRPGSEILVASSRHDVVSMLRDTTDQARRELAHGARARVLASHSSRHRVRELERYIAEVRQRQHSHSGLTGRA